MSVANETNADFQDGTDLKPFLFVSHASADNPRLRPVIEALLSAEIPLWFDKPGDLGMSIADFAGYIPVGESWSEELIGQMASAHAMIYFPTEHYTASDECRFEKAQAFVHRNNSKKNFKIVALVLNQKDFDIFDSREGAIQGAKTFVTEQRGVWTLDPKSQTDLENLIIELRNILAQPNPFLVHDQVKDDEAIREYTIPFRINRDDEKEQVRDVYSCVLEECSYELRDRNRLVRRPLIICHGSNNDEHKRFTSTSLNSTMVQSTPRLFKSGAASEKPLRPKWPSTRGITRSADFVRRYRDTVFDKLKNKITDLPQTRGADEQAVIAQAICDEETTRVISTRLHVSDDMVDNLKQLQAHLQSWVSFWDQFPFHLADGNSHFHLIPVLEVVYGEGKAGGLFSRKSLPWAFRDYLNKKSTAASLTKVCTQVNVEILPEFQFISTSTVHDWMDEDDVIFGNFSEVHCRKIEQDIFENVFGSEASNLSMRDWAEKAGPILRTKYKIGIEQT